MKILAINAGSSSLKLQLFSCGKKSMRSLYKGLINALNLKQSFLQESCENKNFSVHVGSLNHQQAFQKLFERMKETGLIKNVKEIDAIGHRVVHGGEEYTKITPLNEKVKKVIQYYSEFAPLHNPANLTVIEICQKLFPKTAQYVVFDTAFHQTMPKKAFLYALPYCYYESVGIRRFGFHGINHRYITEQTLKLLNKKHSKIITCHLGNGSSITAVKNGQSIDTSMGFTPLEGIPMGTRSGDLDPGVVLYLFKNMKKETNDPAEVGNTLNKESGLLGISEISSDVRELWTLDQKHHKKAHLALEILAYRIAKYIGAYATALNGLDAITFSGGIGENAYYLRQEVSNYLRYLGLKINSQKNKQNATEINHKKSPIKIYVIPANEEVQIAKEVLEICKYRVNTSTNKKTKF